MFKSTLWRRVEGPMPTLASMTLQFGGDVSSLLNIVWLLSFFVFIVYGQRIQVYIVGNDISRALNKLKLMKDKSRKEAVDYFVGTGKTSADPATRIDEFLEYVTIMPVDLDPQGIVGKIEHSTETRDERVRGEVRKLLPSAEPIKVSVAENILLGAETRAEFPGKTGRLYRTAVIGTRGHVLATRSVLRTVRRRAERG